MKTKYPHYFDIAVTSYCQAICAGCQRNDIHGNKMPELVEAHMPLEKFCGKQKKDFDPLSQDNYITRYKQKNK